MFGTTFGGKNRKLVVETMDDDRDDVVLEESNHHHASSGFSFKSIAHNFFETLAEATAENRFDCTPRGPSQMDPMHHEDNDEDNSKDHDDEDQKPHPKPQKKDLEEAELSWRLHPERSMSDWTIQVVTKGTNRWKNYHVHRSVLAVGPRKSDFFVQVFKQADYSLERQQYYPQPRRPPPSEPRPAWCKVGGPEGRPPPQPTRRPPTAIPKNVTKLELESLAADIFPFVLDYMYDTSGFVNINTGNATAYHVLSQRLKIHSLRRRSMEFWQNDLSVKTLATYCIHGHIFRDEEVLRAAEPLVAHHLFDLQEADRAVILETIDPKFFLSVMGFAYKPVKDKHKRSFSLTLSKLVAVYCNLHKSDLSPKMFTTLTDESFLPCIDVEAAKSFLELQDTICGQTNQVSNLTLRCITVLSGIWDQEFVNDELMRVSNENNDAILDILSGTGRQVLNLPGLSGAAMNAFVSATLVNAKKRILKLEKELEDLKTLQQEPKPTSTSFIMKRSTPKNPVSNRRQRRRQQGTPNTASTIDESGSVQLDFLSDEQFFAEIDDSGLPTDSASDFSQHRKDITKQFRKNEDDEYYQEIEPSAVSVKMVKKGFTQSPDQGIQVKSPKKNKMLNNMFRKTTTKA